MPSYALLIGFDSYAATSGLPPLHTAVAAARRMAVWLNSQGWVEDAQTRLLCSPPDPVSSERPATHAEIMTALHELQQLGAHAQPEDRLYLFFAGYALGHFGDQLLLLPEDSELDNVGDKALPWFGLERWLRETGFQTQFCFLSACVCETSDETLAAALASAYLPLEWSTKSSTAADQYILLGREEFAPAQGNTSPGLFSQVLQEGLDGAALVSNDQATATRVIQIEALRSYLERELPARSAGVQRCLSRGSFAANPIIARLGPAPQGELHVTVEPPDAAAHATVAIHHDSSEVALATRSEPPFIFTLLRHALYRIVVKAADYLDGISYVHDTETPCVIRLRGRGDGTLGASRSFAELLIQPEEPLLPVRLFNSYGTPVQLPAQKPRGYLLKTPPDRYRGVLVTPEENIEREIEALVGRTAMLSLPLNPTPEPSPVEKLLAALEGRQKLTVRPKDDQAALLVLTPERVDALDVVPSQPGQQKVVELAHVPADVIGLLRTSYLGSPGSAWLSFTNADGQPCQLMLPLLPGHTTIVGLTGLAKASPNIELLITKTPFQRGKLLAQKRILWAQRFFQADRRTYVSFLLEGLDDEPLALILAGYAMLLNGDLAQVQSYAKRLLAIAPSSSDGTVLLAATNPSQLESSIINAPVPLASLWLGLHYSVIHVSPTRLHPLAQQVIWRANSKQLWLVVEGSDMHSRRRSSPLSLPEILGQAEPAVDVLLLTATATETKAVLAEFTKERSASYQFSFMEDKTYFDLGYVHGAHIVLVQSEMGSGGPGGSTLTVANSLRLVRPKAIIMLGIAFGLVPEQQQIGQILVATQILDYERQRVGTSPSGEAAIILRGERVASSPRLLDRFRSGSMNWQGAQVAFGLLLSGAKLIDQQALRDQLHQLQPEALGGEMEGAGLSDAAYEQQVDWIIVKAISDFADGQKHYEKEQRQHIATRNVARFVMHILRQGGFAAPSTSEA